MDSETRDAAMTPYHEPLTGRCSLLVTVARTHTSIPLLHPSLALNLLFSSSPTKCTLANDSATLPYTNATTLPHEHEPRPKRGARPLQRMSHRPSERTQLHLLP